MAPIDSNDYRLTTSFGSQESVRSALSGSPVPNATTTLPSSASSLSSLDTMMVGSAAAGVVNAFGGIVTAFINHDTMQSQLDAQAETIAHQERMANSTAGFASEQEDNKVALVKDLKETQAAVNLSKEKLAKAENDLAVTKVAVQEAKLTGKAEKLDTRKLDAFFNPGDTRLRYPRGNPLRAA